MGATKPPGSSNIDGKTLPILFIIRGKFDGPLHRYELPKYPLGYYYTVQENTWMDATG
ncbi:hypothetical protein V7S43_017176 [Phytophthora oleae]|uniref:DDE-1 domain-containing protein n=1 Tax=Phytophthora oleae TaxID=2107226 RepID=A0ABD3EUE8_9STRA